MYFLVFDLNVDVRAKLRASDRIRDRLKAWIDSPVTTLVLGTRDPKILHLMADAVSH